MANIKDVAREAGVSVATVSRVFSGAAPVSEATAERVRAVAARLDYVPDAAARSLITGRTHALGVVLPRTAWGVLHRGDPRTGPRRPPARVALAGEWLERRR